MRAVQLQAHGGPEQLELVDLPMPQPAAGEVLLRVLAVSVNHLDLWIRRGMPGFKVAFPLIPGCDGTAEVVELGADVSSLSVGMHVLLEPGFNAGDSVERAAGQEHLAEDYVIRGEHCDGFDVEFVCIPADRCTPMPAGLDPIRTAAAPLVFMTAWGMLHERARVKAGETVLVIGGTSGVGSAAIQLAKRAGARVLTTAGNAQKRSLAVELGADEAVDHGDADWPKHIKAMTDGRGVDVVIEHVGPATWKGSMRSLARNGRLVTCGGTTGPKVSVLLPHLFVKNLSLMGSTMGPRSAYPDILAGLADGSLRPVVDRVLPMSEVREAHRLLEERQVSGKLILIPGE